jgi:hypothetical protein
VDLRIDLEDQLRRGRHLGVRRQPGQRRVDARPPRVPHDRGGQAEPAAARSLLRRRRGGACAYAPPRSAAAAQVRRGPARVDRAAGGHGPGELDPAERRLLRDPEDRNIRIAPTLPPEDELERAITVLATAILCAADD